MDRRKKLIRLGIAVLIVVLLLLLLRGCGEKPPAEPDEDLLGILIELRDELEWPGITVETAAKNLKTAEAAIDFVRNGTLFSAYPKSFADPDAVLRTRVANCVDRARLLDALLKEMGLETRVRSAGGFSTRPSEKYLGDLDRTVPAALQKLADYLDHDLSTTDAEFASLFDAFEKRTDSMNGEVKDAMEKIRELVPETFEGEAPKLVYPKVNDWVWVEYRTAEEEEWVKAETTFTSNKITPGFSGNHTIASSETRIQIEGVRGDGSRVELMSWSGETAGRDAEVFFLPADRKPEDLLNVAEPNEIWAWAPVLQIDGKTHRGKGFTPEGAVLSDVEGEPAVVLNQDGHLDFHTPKVETLTTASATCGDGKRVRLRMHATTSEKPRWHAGHFSVTDNGMPVRGLRLESVRAEPRPVILVIDTSGSMTEGNRVQMAREAAKELVKVLGNEQKIAIVSHGWGNVSVSRELTPKREGDAKKTIDGLQFWGEQRILGSINKALELTDEPSYIVFLTDGEDTESDNQGYSDYLADTLQALKESDSLVFPIGIGEADSTQLSQFAEASGTDYMIADNTEDLPDLYSQLGRLLSGAIELSYAIPEDAEPGSERNAIVRLEGFEGEAPANYTVNEGTPFGLVRIEMKVKGPPNLNANRTIADFSDGYDGWRMMTRTAVWTSPSFYPQHIVESRRVDNWIETLLMAEFIDGGDLDREQLGRSISFRHAHTINTMRIYHTALTGDGHFPMGPALWLSSESLRVEGENIVRRSRLDWPSSFDWPVAKDREAMVKSLLAVLAAEGAAYNTDSVNVRLLSETKSLAVHKSEEEVDDKLPASLQRQLEKDNRVLITQGESPNAGWSIDLNQGAVYGYMAEGYEIAKGASLEEVAAEYRKIRSMLQLYSYLGGAGLSGTFNPAGGVFSALCSFFDQVVRMYCYSALMMNQVATAIETGGEDFDPEQAKKTAEKLCETSGDPEEFARNLMRETAYGFVRGTAENVVAGGVANAVGERTGVKSGSMADAALGAVTSAGVSAVDPTPGSFGDLMKSMNRMGEPTGVSSPSLIQKVDAAILDE